MRDGKGKEAGGGQVESRVPRNPVTDCNYGTLLRRRANTVAAGVPSRAEIKFQSPLTLPNNLVLFQFLCLCPVIISPPLIREGEREDTPLTRSKLPRHALVRRWLD